MEGKIKYIFLYIWIILPLVINQCSLEIQHYEQSMKIFIEFKTEINILKEENLKFRTQIENEIFKINSAQNLTNSTLDLVSLGISNIKKDIDYIKIDNTSNKNDILSSKNDILSIRANISDIKNDVSKIKSDMSSLQTEDISIKTELISIKNNTSLNNNSLNDKIIFIKSDVNSIKFDITSLKNEIDTLKTDNNSAKKDIDSIKIDILSVKADVVSIKIQINGITSENSSMKNEINSIKSDIGVVKTDYVSINTNISSLITYNISSKTQITSLMSQIFSIRSDSNDIKKSLTDTQSSISTIQSFSDYINSEKYYYMYSQDIIVYRDIFEAVKLSVISKLGNPTGWDDTTYSVNPWNYRKLLRIGIGKQTDFDGLLVNVPTGYDIIWVCHLNDRRTAIRVQSKEYPNDVQTSYGFGIHRLNEIYPNGSMSDSFYNLHKWMPLALYRSGIHHLHCDYDRLDCWLSGIAFGKNIWNHAKHYAPTYYYALNKGNIVYPWNQNTSDGTWNNDELAKIIGLDVIEIFVPIIPNGKDKLLYYLAHNNSWEETITSLSIFYNQEWKQIENFKTTYFNPFSIHINSKLYQRYYATKISKDYINSDSRFIKVRIDTTTLDSNYQLHFRALGTHDFK